MRRGKDNGKQGTAKSRKNQNTWKTWYLQILGNIGSGHHKTNGNERKNNKRVPQTNKKASWNQTLLQKTHQRNKHLGSLCWILRTILKMDKWRTQTKIPKEKSLESLITATSNSTDNIDKQNNNSLETEIEIKTTVWLFQVTNLQNLTLEDLDMAMERKPYEKNLISSRSSANSTIRTNYGKMKINKVQSYNYNLSSPHCSLLWTLLKMKKRVTLR